MIRRAINLSNSQSFFVFGPRGSGKSTLLNQHFKDLLEKKEVLWINLLEQKLEFELSNHPDSLLDRWKGHRSPWIVIDEIQKIPSLLDVVHRGIEDHKIRFALTGSSARKLKRGGANLLANRAASYVLSPFSSIELGANFKLDQALSTGLLPRFWSELSEESDRVRSLYSYIQTYLKEEVAAEQLVRNLDPFRRVLVAAAQSNARILNYAAIERDAGVAHSQAERHFEILTDTMIGRHLEPFSNSIRKRQTKKSKFYFFDTGVVRALKTLAGEPLHSSTYEYGELFETFLINEFFKLNESLEKRWRFSYLRTKDDVEIDLIVEKPNGDALLIEIKSSDQKPTQEKLDSFIKISNEFKSCQKYLLSNFLDEIEVRGIRCLHWQRGLREIFEL
jgi:predicted AAA+ superfamily ATPase